MDWDHFIIIVYYLICEPYHALQGASSLRRGSFDPVLADEEVITMEIGREYFKSADR